MLVEYLSGEGGAAEEQVSASQISRLIIAGNSLATLPDEEPTYAERKAVRYKSFYTRRYNYCWCLNYSVDMVMTPHPSHHIPQSTSPRIY
jgi:hypothetical protein